MNEFLIIRLGHDPEQPVFWLVADRDDLSIIASGELAAATELASLAERAEHREVIVLVSGKDVYLGQVELPEKGRRQALAALPFLLEDELAGDVEQQHVVCAKIVENKAWAVAVEHRRMEMWLAMLAEAGLHTRRIVPDVLALPQPADDSTWHMVEIDHNWLIRLASWRGMVVDSDSLTAWLPLLKADAEQQEIAPSAISYSPWPVADATLPVQEELAELPLGALVPGALSSSANLLKGAYAPQQETAFSWRKWRWVASLFAVGLALHLVGVGVDWYRYHQQQQRVEQQTVQVFRSVVPGQGPVRNPRGQMTVKLRGLAQQGDDVNVLSLLQQLVTGFNQVEELRFSSLRFDDVRNELRIQVTGKNFDVFEKLKQALSDQFEVDIGALNSQGEQVSGAVTLRSRS